MERTKKPTNNSSGMSALKMQVLQEFAARLALSSQLGMSYAGQRDLYDVLGYPKELTFEDYYSIYSRQDVAGAVIDRPIKQTWSGDFEIQETDDDQETPFEKQWMELSKELKLKSVFIQLDRLACLGQYALLFVGFSDAQSSIQQSSPVKDSPKVLYVKAISQKQSTVVQYETNMQDARYGKPKLYQVTFTALDGSSTTLEVHYSRILHVAYDCVEGDLVGTPALKKVFNRCKDIEKISGGSAEMYWRGAYPGYSGKVDKDFQLTTKIEEDLRTQIQEYENNLRRILINQGVDLTSFQTQISDPSKHLDVQLQLISAATGIPKRILVGSERGELSSSQDQDQWYSLIQTRREDYAEGHIIKPFIEWLIKLKVIQSYQEKFSVKWPDLFSQSEKERADIGKTRTEALKIYASEPLTQGLVPLPAFFEFFLGLDPDQAELIHEMMLAETMAMDNPEEEMDPNPNPDSIIEEETM